MTSRFLAMGLSVSACALVASGAFANELAATRPDSPVRPALRDETIKTDSAPARNFTLVLRDNASIDAASIEKYFASYGFKTEYRPVSNTIKLFGTYAQAEQAGHFRYETVTGKEVKFTHPNARPSFGPDIDAALVGTSFGAGPKAHAMSHVVHPDDSKTYETVAGYGPAEFAKFYDIEPLYKAGINGTGETIDIAACGTIYPSDIASYASTYGLPAAKVTIIPIDGSPIYYGIEPTLDVERVFGTAPGTNIRLFTVPDCEFTQFIDMFAAIVEDQKAYPADALTISYGAQEFVYSYYGLETDLYGQAAQIAKLTKLGVTVFASSGDSGSWFYNFTAPSVDTDVIYPASDINVVSVGGTTLIRDKKDNKVDEHGWADGGGGISSFFHAPSYQKSFPGVYSTTHKNLPDLSFDADPFTGAAEYFTPYGGLFAIGGTSVSSPSIAGVVSLLDAGRHKAGQTSIQSLPATFYNLSRDFTDITSGSNGFFAAKVGYDNTTGLGVPDVYKLYLDLTQ